MRNGFMCPSEASTAVWSVVVPRSRSKIHKRSVSLDDTRLINCSSYSKLVHSATATFNSAAHKKCDSLSSANIQQRSQDQDNGSSQLHKTTADQIFQVTHILSSLHTFSFHVKCNANYKHFLHFFLVSRSTCCMKKIKTESISV